jgi:hypothetical protein
MLGGVQGIHRSHRDKALASHLILRRASFFESLLRRKLEAINSSRTGSTRNLKCST